VQGGLTWSRCSRRSSARLPRPTLCPSARLPRPASYPSARLPRPASCPSARLPRRAFRQALCRPCVCRPCGCSSSSTLRVNTRARTRFSPFQPLRPRSCRNRQRRPHVRTTPPLFQPATLPPASTHCRPAPHQRRTNSERPRSPAHSRRPPAETSRCVFWGTHCRPPDPLLASSAVPFCCNDFRFFFFRCASRLPAKPGVVSVGGTPSLRDSVPPTLSLLPKTAREPPHADRRKTPLFPRKKPFFLLRSSPETATMNLSKSPGPRPERSRRCHPNSSTCSPPPSLPSPPPR